MTGLELTGIVRVPMVAMLQIHGSQTHNPPDFNYGIALLEAIGLLALICIAGWLIVRWSGRRTGLSRFPKYLRVLDFLNLMPRVSLYVVEISDKVLVVGVGERGSPQLLTSMDKATLKELPTLETSSFKNILERMLSKTDRASSILLWLSGVVLGSVSTPAFAKPTESALGSSPIYTLILLAVLSLLPFVFMTVTSFVKLSVVFSILRNALGTGQVPSGTIIAALAAILSLYVMAPVGRQITVDAGPSFNRMVEATSSKDSVNAFFEVLSSCREPLRMFLKKNSGSRERALFFDLAKRSRPADQRQEIGSDDLMVVIPSFLITELSEAFKIGFLVFVPFLIIDMVVANVLLALGMHMLSPTTISLPFKLLLFVMVDGWYLLARSLILGYS